MKNIEKGYASIFSSFEEKDGKLLAVDSQMPDMYDHNFTYIRKNTFSDVDIITYCDEQLKDGKKKFFKLVLEDTYSQKEVQAIIDKLNAQTPYTSEIENYGRYVITDSCWKNWNTRTDCEIRLLTTQEEINELIQADIAVDGERLGTDFCTRRTNSMYTRILQTPNAETILLYSKDLLLGSVVVYVNDAMCKIEEFSIVPDWQHKGYGTTLLKGAVQKAFEMGATTIFADTDEDDTAKEMYMKLGFQKHSENHCIFMEP